MPPPYNDPKLCPFGGKDLTLPPAFYGRSQAIVPVFGSYATAAGLLAGVRLLFIFDYK